jgi:hypothetical protein
MYSSHTIHNGIPVLSLQSLTVTYARNGRIPMDKLGNLLEDILGGILIGIGLIVFVIVVSFLFAK